MSIPPISGHNMGSSAWDDGITVLCANDFDKVCRVGGDGHWRIPQKETGPERKLRDLDSHAQRSSRHAQINITQHPTAQWTAQQIIEAFPFETAPSYVLRDRDGIYGRDFQRRVAGIGIAQLCTAPRSPWQNPYVERLIGSVRHECLDHLIILDEYHLHRFLRTYLAYYHGSLPHLSLNKDATERHVQESSGG